jgi:hypothetical protein
MVLTLGGIFGDSCENATISELEPEESASDGTGNRNDTKNEQIYTSEASWAIQVSAIVCPNGMTQVYNQDGIMTCVKTFSFTLDTEFNRMDTNTNSSCNGSSEDAMMANRASARFTPFNSKYFITLFILLHLLRELLICIIIIKINSTNI